MSHLFDTYIYLKEEPIGIVKSTVLPLSNFNLMLQYTVRTSERVVRLVSCRLVQFCCSSMKVIDFGTGLDGGMDCIQCTHHTVLPASLQLAGN